MAKALWNFGPVAPGDISFQKGDIFDADVDKALGWWHGCKSDQTGQFPASDVEVIVHPRETERQIVKALYDFSAQTVDELNLRKDMIFEADTFRATDRWRGYIHGFSGDFPANYVIVLSSVSSSERPTLTPQNRYKVRAHSDHFATNASELSFRAGEVIDVEVDIFQLRWKAYLNGMEGMIPAHRVLLIPGPPIARAVGVDLLTKASLSLGLSISNRSYQEPSLQAFQCLSLSGREIRSGPAALWIKSVHRPKRCKRKKMRKILTSATRVSNSVISIAHPSANPMICCQWT